MEDKAKLQVNILDRMQRARDNFRKSPKERLKSSDHLSTRLQILEQLWADFNKTHNEIVIGTDARSLNESAYCEDDVYTKTEDLYIDYKCELTSALSKLKPTVGAASVTGPGSQASLITESAVQLLGLKKMQHRSTISGLGSDEGATVASKSIVKLKIQSLRNPKFEYMVNAFVLNKLTSTLPEKKIVVELWSEFKNIELADPLFDKPDKIDLLLGADVYGQILEEGIIKQPPGALIAQKTTLGWILSGPIDKQTSAQNTISVNHLHVENELLKKFWELEADSSVKSVTESYTEEEKRCEEIFKATTKRDDTGRYIVKLPFRDEDPSCKYGNSKIIATKRFMQLEKRFAKDPQLKTRYSDVIKEYLELGHMERVSEEDKLKPDAVYLPHHAVIREDKTTSKLRVVFDASCPGSNGVSLNQDLLVGPTLQPDLRHIILKWRLHPICLVADIVKMYRQVKVDNRDADFQRIVWRERAEDDIDHFRLMRVTFGTASAPYLAVRALRQVAYDEGDEFPLAAGRVLNHFYMDDLLTGCESVEEGKKIYKELDNLLAKGGFQLQKWTTNDKKLMQEINKEKENNLENLPLKIDTTTKILGLTWNRSNDEFEYTVQLPPVSSPITKRKVISDIARLFDPLGCYHQQEELLHERFFTVVWTTQVR
ncbi:uncharacterized protein [Choristoneura fumiferana]|uniref:uncharacterized protein n=1 Tax=Choristoneura fumiferana TaxID=7141 RepID=UPI003D15DBA0